MDAYIIEYIQKKHHLFTRTAAVEKIIRDYVAYGMDEPKRSDQGP